MLNVSSRLNLRRFYASLFVAGISIYLSACTGGSTSQETLASGGLGLKLVKVSGDSQVTPPASSWSQPLVVRVVEGSQGLADIPVTFSDITSTGTQIVNAVVTTDSSGYAKTSAISPNVSNLQIKIQAKLADDSKVVFDLETRSFPDTPVITLRDPVTFSTSYAQQVGVEMSITDVSTAVRWCVSEQMNSRPSDGSQTCTGGVGTAGGGWSTSKPTNFTLSSINGAKSVYIWVADQYNQVSLFPSSATIFLDTIAPGIPIVNLSDVNSGSLTDTSDQTVNFSVSNDGDASYWCIFAQMWNDPAVPAPARTAGCWVSTKPTTLDMIALGLNRVTVWTKDLAGNVSPGSGIQYINFTTLTIADPAFTLKDQNTASMVYSRGSTVDLTITGDPTATKWCVSEQQSSRPLNSLAACVGGAGLLNGWSNVRPTTFTLSGGDGLKTVYVWVANPLNNTNGNVVSRQITVDTIAPAIPIADLTDPNTGLPNFTNQSTVNLTITGDTDAVAWCKYEKASLAAPPSLPAYNDSCWVGTRPTTVALTATGARRVYVYTKDSAQNVSPAPAVAMITYTTTPPASPVGVLRDTETNSDTLAKHQTVNMSINSPAGTVRWCVSQTQTSAPANGTATCNGGAGSSNGWYTASPTTFALSNGDGLKTVYFWVADGANNVNSTTSTTTITLDLTPPATPVAVISDPSSGSTLETNQIIATLAVTGDTDATRWCRLIKDAAAPAPATPTLTDVCWTLTRPTTVVLEQTGNRELYLFTRDAAGNIGSPGIADIIYSTDVPSDPTVILADSVTSLTSYANHLALSLNISNDTGAVKWCVSETQTTRPLLGTSTCTGGLGGANGWSTSKPTTWTLSATDGVKRVYVWTANTANSVNNNPSSGGLTLDRVVPSQASATLADPNTLSTTNTNQATVTLSITGEDPDVTAWCVLEQASAAAAPAVPLFSNACWNTSKPVTQVLGAVGSRKVYVYFRDRAYNVSATAGAATINYSTTAPVVPTLAVTDPTTNSASYVRQVGISAAITGDTGAVKWCLSETQTTRPTLGTSNCAGGAGSSNGWFTARPTAFGLSTGDGLKTIYLWTADSANNTSATAATDTITLDTLPPSVPFVTLSDTLTSSTTVTNQSVANLAIQFDTDAVKWCVIEQSFATAVPSQPAWNAGCWAGTRPTTQTLGATGIRRVFVYTQDIALNVTAAAAVSQINYTTTPPTDPALTLTNSTTGSTTVTRDLIVTPSITSPTGTVKWCLSETQTTAPSSGSASCTGGAGPTSGWYTSLPNTYTLSAATGLKTVYLWVADTNNNVNANAVTATITVDTTPPATPVVSMSDPNNGSTTHTNQFNVDLSITGDTDAVKWCPLIQAAAAAAPAAPSINDSCWRNTRPTTQLIDATGARKLYVFTRDLAANIGTAGEATIDYSILPPADAAVAVAHAVTGLTDYAKTQALTLSITSDTGAVRWCVSESQSTRPALGTSTCNGGSGGSSGWFTARPTTFNLSAGEALKRVYVWTADIYNNVNANPTSATITLDTTAPAAPSVSMQDPNTGSSAQTNQNTVTLNIGATIDALAWCAIEQPSASAAPAAPLYNNACFNTTKQVTQVLGSLGNRTVYIYTRDRAYNVAASAGSAAITYSTTAPVTATLALSDATTSSALYARQVSIAASITGDTGAVKWCLSETQTTRPAQGTSACAGGTGSSNGWHTARPTTFALSSGDGAKTVYLWTADLANNTSASGATAAITLDTLTPTIPTVSLSDPNTFSTAFTNQASVSLSITSDTDATAWCVIEQAAATAAPANPLYNNGCWVGTRPTSATLGAQGSRRAYVFTKDVAANVSLAAAIASISYSTSAPLDPVLVLSNSVTGSRSYTNDRDVAVSINNPVGAVRWCISETQATRPATGTAACTGGAGPSNGWYDSMPSTFQLSVGDNTKTVYIWVANASNNTNSNQSSTTISLLVTPPAAPTVALSDPNTNSTLYTNQSSVNMAITADTGGTAWCAIAQDAAAAAPSAPSVSSTCWVLTRPTSVALGLPGSRKVYVFLRDPAMNISAPGSAAIALSSTAPADPALDISHTATGLTTYARTTALTIAVTSDAGATRWCVSETQSVKPALGTSTCAGGSGPSSGWYTVRPTAFTLSSGDGLKRVYVWIADASNNTNDNAISDTITLDTQPPGTYNITGLTGGADTTPDSWLGTTLVPTLSWGAAAGASSYTVEIKNNAGTATVCAAQSTAATTFTFAGCNLVDATSYKAYVTAVDDAQNTLAAANNAFTFTVKLSPPGAFNISGATGSQDTTADQWSGTSLPTISWTASTGVNSYIVRVLANDGVTVMCPSQTKSAGTLSHDYSTTGCSGIVDNTLYQIEVVAVDVAGNTATATNNLFLIRTDLTTPTVNISGSPAATAILAASNFTFAGADTISGIAAMQCKLDAGSFTACDSVTTQAYSVADGAHAFTVKAIDRVGLTQTSTYNWTVDTVLPNAFTITGATGPTDSTLDSQLQNDTMITAHWTNSSNASEYDVSILLAADDSIVCPVVTKPAGSTSHTFNSCTLANPGNYKIKVVARRGYGTTYTPTPLAVAAVKDSVTGVITVSNGTVSSGSSVTVTLVGYQNGVQLSSNVLNPTFAVGTGTSNGTFGAISYAGAGTYTASFTGSTAGTVSQITATSTYLSGFTGQTPANIRVIAGGVSASVSTITLSKSTVEADNSDLVDVTVNVRDAAGNAITGATIGASRVGGVSTGVFSSFTETPAGSGIYAGTFSGRVSGTATAVHITANGTLLSAHPTIQVLPGPPVKIAVSGPGSINTHTCSTAYSLTLRDYYDNLASALNNVQIDFSGLGLGNFSMASDCSTSTTSTDIFLGGSTAAPVYVLARGPNPSAIFTFKDHVGALTDGTRNVAINGTLAWLGTTGQMVWGETQGITSRSSLDGMQEPRAVWINSTTNLMYVADTLNHRVVRYNLATNQMTGWIGRIDSVDGIDCGTTVSTGTAAPNWCTGGSAQVSAGGNWDGMFNSPSDITGDGVFLYVLDSVNHRIVRIKEDTGVFKGWFGRILSATSMTCQSGSPSGGAATPNWCYGGTSQAAGTTNYDGMFTFSFNASIRAFFDPAANSKMLAVMDAGNSRMVRLRVDNTDVYYDGWAGRSNTATLADGANTTGCSGVTVGDATPGWCKGGVSLAAPGGTAPLATNFDNMFRTMRGLTVSPGTGASIAYFGDLDNGRLVAFDMTLGKTAAWSGRSTFEYRGAGGTNCSSYNTNTAWCTGGVPVYNGYVYPNSATNTAARATFPSNILALDTDGTDLYTTFATTNLYGIYRFPMSTMYSTATNSVAWAGRISSTPASGAGCTTTPLGFTAPNWCYGGDTRNGYADGQFWAPTSLFINYTDGNMYTVDRQLNKIQITAKATGVSGGWIGSKANSSPATWSVSYTPGLMGNLAYQNEDLSFAQGYTGNNTTINPAWGLATDGTSSLYVADTGNHRIKRYVASTGLFMGWLGRTSVVPTGIDDACTSITSGALTPTWCYGGSSQVSNVGGSGQFDTPRGLAVDSNYLYVADAGNHAIKRIARHTGGFAGWLGRTGNSPGTLTGFDTSSNAICGGVGATQFTGAWCAAGNHSASSGNGMLNAPRGVAIDSATGHMYVADTGNNRVSMYNNAGLFYGWIGRVSTVPVSAGSTSAALDTTCSGLTSALTTPNWCMGGTAAASTGTTAFGGFTSPQAVSVANGELYVADTNNNKIHKFTALTGTYLGWIGRTNTTKPQTSGPGSTIPAAACTTALTAGDATPGWCVGGSYQAAGSSVFDGAFTTPTGVWADPGGSYFYVVDAGNHRVTKHEKTTGTFVGWRGMISTPPTGGDGTCAGTLKGNVTPGWCKGGLAMSSRQLGGFYNPVAITGDANFVYVTDTFNNRIVALPK